jgi:hypothetical protein
MIDFDKDLYNIIQNDELNFDVNPSTIHRLRNHLNIVCMRSSAKMNSFLPLFRLKELRPLAGIKVGVVCLLFFMFYGYQQINSSSNSFSSGSDTTLVCPTADTNNISSLNDTTHSEL